MSLLKYILMLRSNPWPIETGNLLLDGEVDPIVDTNGNHTITQYGDVTVSDVDPACGTKSIIFDGTGDYLTVPHSTDFDFGSGDFTIDFWYTPTNGTAITRFFGKGTNPGSLSFFLYFDGSAQHFYWSVDGSTALYPTAAYTYTSGIKTHTAIVRNGNTISFYKDGILQGSPQSMVGTMYNNASTLLYIGKDTGISNLVNGKIDYLRFTKGTALWTTNFNLTDKGLYYPDGTLNI